MPVCYLGLGPDVPQQIGPNKYNLKKLQFNLLCSFKIYMVFCSSGRISYFFLVVLFLCNTVRLPKEKTVSFVTLSHYVIAVCRWLKLPCGVLL